MGQRRLFLGLAAAFLCSALGCGPPTASVQPTFSVVHAAPNHGSVDVDLDVVPYLGFSVAVGGGVDDNIALRQMTTDGPLAVDIEYFLDDQSLSVRFVPRNSLQTNTEYRIVVSPELVAENGASIGAAWSSSFFTTSTD